MKEVLEYLKMFMWRLVYLEKNECSLTLGEVRYVVNFLNKYISLFNEIIVSGDYLDSVGKLIVTDFMADLKSLSVELSVKGGKITRVNVSDIDRVMKALSQFEFVDKTYDIKLGQLEGDMNNGRMVMFVNAVKAIANMRDYYSNSDEGYKSVDSILLPVEKVMVANES